MAIQPKFYETLYLVRPDISPDDLTVIQEKVTSSINSGNGEITRDEKWADRDLAYPINDYTRGTYYIVEFKALPNVIAGIEKHLAFHNVDVLRFMTVNVEEPSAKAAEAPASAPSAASTTPPSAPPAAPSTTPSTPPAASTKPEPAKEAPPATAEKSAPAATETPESTPPAAETAPEADTLPDSTSEEETSSASGFTAAPPLSSSEDKESGGEK